MINGLHVVIYSRDAERDRAFLRDVLKFPHVDAGGGWLIFAAPPAELAVHPGEEGGQHEAFLMCGDVKAVAKSLHAAGQRCAPISDEGWGLLTSFTLPGGGKMGVYQPRHAMPPRQQSG